MRGTIRSFDGADGLGWIDLDDGTAMRFGLSACNALVPSAGMRVDVLSAEKRGNVLRATSVQPFLEQVDIEQVVWPEALQAFAVEPRWIDGVQRETRIAYKVFDREAVHARSPRWPDAVAFSELALPAPRGAEPPEPHPFFAPWHDGIVAAGVGALKLTARPGGTAGQIGGAGAPLEGAWPRCTTHGPLALLATIEPVTIAHVVGHARRLTLHVCIECLNAERHCWLDEQSNAARVEWSAVMGSLATLTAGVFEEIGLAAEPALSIPPAWTFKPRRDVEGHVPVGGVAAELLDVSILRDRDAELRYAYEEAYFAYDRHYTNLQADVTLGGFSTHPFALCGTCRRPLRQLLRIHDYFCSPPLADVFEGSNDFTLLSCERTPACGGPTRGLLVIGP